MRFTPNVCLLSACLWGLWLCGCSESGALSPLAEHAPSAAQALTADGAVYNFETSTQGFGLDCHQCAIAGSVTQALGTQSPGPVFAGHSSLRAHFVGKAYTAPVVSTSAPVQGTPNTYVTFHMWLPRDTGAIYSVTAFVQYNQYVTSETSVTTADGSLPSDSWVEMKVLIPACSTTMLSLGVQLNLMADFTGDIYLDDIDYE